MITEHVKSAVRVMKSKGVCDPGMASDECKTCFMINVYPEHKANKKYPLQERQLHMECFRMTLRWELGTENVHEVIPARLMDKAFEYLKEHIEKYPEDTKYIVSEVY